MFIRFSFSLFTRERERESKIEAKKQEARERERERSIDQLIPTLRFSSSTPFRNVVSTIVKPIPNFSGGCLFDSHEI